jgi:tetratricopeptide (TPR) repeat protein
MVVVLGLMGGCATRPVSQETQAPPATAPAVQTATQPAPSPAEDNDKEKKETPAVPAASVPPDVMYKVLVAEVAIQRGQYDLAIKNYLDLGKQYHDPRLLERAARVAAYAHDNKQALEAAKLWVEMEPDNVEAREVASAFYIRSGKYDEAQKQLEALLTINAKESSKSTFMLIAGLLGRQQDKQAALEVMQRLVKDRPDDSNAQLALSRLAVRAGALDQAEQAIKRAVELQPDRLDAQVQEARVLVMRGKSDEAVVLLKKAVKKHPKNLDLRTAYAKLLVDAQQMDKAYEQFKRVDKDDPDQPDILLALGIVALQLEKVDEGEKYFTRLNHLNRGFESESSYYLGRIAEDFHKDPGEAIKWYKKVEDGDQYFESQLRIAFLLAKQGHVEQARGQLSAITTRGPADRMRIFLVDGQILRDAGRIKEAIEVYTTGLKELPDNTDLLYARAMAEDKLADMKHMEADLRSILSREPDNVDALNALGYSLADRTTRYDEALKLIQRALELRPDSYFILDSMGWVNYRLGHYQEAISYLRRALDMSSDSEIAAHLTEVLWVKGDKQGARKVWDKALKVAPGNKVLLDVMNRLDHKP